MNQYDELSSELARMLRGYEPLRSAKSALELKLEQYKKPASMTEKDKQQRAERMVKDAINNWDGLSNTQTNFIIKGSYANNTNVKQDSDVDIAVIHGGMHYINDSALNDADKIQRIPISNKHYPGIKFREQVERAAVAKYGGTASDISGNTAVTISENNSRVSADIVPSFMHYRYSYDHIGRIHKEVGTITFRKDGTHVINHPHQQLSNGISKNNATNKRYKHMVRILKRIENDLVAAGKIKQLPSYFMECLVHAVPNELMGSTDVNSLTTDLKNILGYIYNHATEPDGEAHTWKEPNGIKLLFHPSQPWDKQDAVDLTVATWNHLELTN